MNGTTCSMGMKFTFEKSEYEKNINSQKHCGICKIEFKGWGKKFYLEAGGYEDEEQPYPEDRDDYSNHGFYLCKRCATDFETFDVKSALFLLQR